MIIGIIGKLGAGKDTVAQLIQYLDWKQKVEDGNSDLVTYSHTDFMRGTHGHLSGWKIKKYADALKDTVCMWIGCTREQLEDREFKETPLGEEWTKYEVYWQGVSEPDGTFATWEEAANFAISIGGDVDEIELPGVIEKVQLTPRRLLQLLGTEAGRQVIHPNIWVNALMSKYEITDLDHYKAYPQNYDLFNWIITDVRFPNEVKAIKDRGGIIVYVKRHVKERHPELWQEFSHSEFYEWEAFVKERGLYDKFYHPSETSLDYSKVADYTIPNDWDIEALIKNTKQFYDEALN